MMVRQLTREDDRLAVGAVIPSAAAASPPAAPLGFLSIGQGQSHALLQRLRGVLQKDADVILTKSHGFAARNRARRAHHTHQTVSNRMVAATGDVTTLCTNMVHQVD